MALDDPYPGFSWPPPDWSWAQPSPTGANPLAIAPPVPSPVAELPYPELAPPPTPEPAPAVEPAPPLQPGLGIPQAAVDAAAAAQPAEIEMPPEYVGQLPEIEMPAEYVGGGAPAAELPALASPIGAVDSFLAKPEDPYPLRKGYKEGEDPLSEEEIGKLSPLERATYQFDRQQHVEREAMKRLDELQRTDNARAAEAENEFLESQKRAKEITEAALADSEALANEKPAKFTDSIGNVVGSVLGIVLGAYGASATGGRNAGVEGMMAAMDRFSKEQLDEYNRKAGNVDRKLNVAARLRDAGYNDFQTTTMIRMAGLQRARAQVLTDMQNFDPRGTAALARLDFAGRLQGQIEDNARALHRQNIEDATKETALAKAQLDVMEKERKLRGVGQGGGQVMPIEFFRSMYPNAPVPPVPMTEKAYRSWIGTTKAGAEASQALGAETPEQKRTREFGINGPDGKPLLGNDDRQVQGRDIAEANKITEQIADTDEVIRMMDEVLRLRKEHGWSSDLFKSPEWRKMKSNWAGVILKKKNIDELGVIAGPDMELMGDALGAKDPTSLQDPTAGIEQGRQNAVQGLYGRLRIKGVSDKSMPQYPETWKKQKPRATAVDASINEAVKAETFDELKPTAAQIGSPSHETILKDQAAKTERAVATVNYLADAARGDGPEAQKARAGLGEVASKATSPRVREMAATALRNLAASEAASQEVPK